MKLPTLYLVVTEFRNLGIGSSGDATGDRNRAYDDFAECTVDGQPTRVFMLEFCVETNALESASEITDEFEAEFEGICNNRNITLTETMK